MRVRSSRTEQLTLVPADGGAPVTLFTASRDLGELTTQDIFQVSPDGAYLAYAATGSLHVRATDGSERTIFNYTASDLMRFSPDGKELAVAAQGHVLLFDLSTGKTRELATYLAVRQLEWIRDAVIVHVREQDSPRDALVELPRDGQPRTLLDRERNDIGRFVAAATGTRVVAFLRDNAHDSSETRVIAFDVATPAGTYDLGVVHDWVTNAAASLDGEHIAFTTANAVFTANGNEHAKAISQRGDIDSLWFAHDGRLGYASATSVTILDGRHAQRFDRDGPIVMLRFDPITSRALVATPSQAWDVATAAPQRLVKPGAGSTLLGVDHFAGGIVLWTRLRS
jgi:hypothetical protein